MALPALGVLPEPPAGSARLSAKPAAASAPSSSTHAIQVVVDGNRSTTLSFSDTLFWISKHDSPEGKTQPAADPAEAFVCVPVELVLNASYVEDSDGASLYVRLLAPPTQQSSPLLPFAKVKSRARAVAETEASWTASRDALPQLETRRQSERLLRHLEGPCQKLRLLKVEARVSPNGEGDPSTWAQRLMEKAYPATQPFRRFKVLINPIGGPGKAKQLFASKVRPILEAAGCKMDVQVTTHVNHGLEIAKTLTLSDYDAVLLVSGDGMAHEVLNGFAQRPDAVDALRMPMCPIPAGSGNALCVNLLGPDQGFNLALASLNAVKGKALPLDICAVTQPRARISEQGTAARSRGKRFSRMVNRSGSIAPSATRGETPLESDADPTLLSEAPEVPYEQYYSFLSQAIGLMADVDLGTENMRALGDTRFILGYIGGVLSNAECPIDIDVKLGARGTKNKGEMRQRVQDVKEKGQWRSSSSDEGNRTQDKGSGDVDGPTAEEEDVAAETSAWNRDAFGRERPHSEGIPPLRHGAVTDRLGHGEDGVPPLMSAVDPSWPRNLLVGSKTSPQPETDPEPSSWARLSAPVSTLYAGKIPFVARDLMQFPFALPGDGTVDIALMLHGGGRAGKLRAINEAESGRVVYDDAVVYLKVEAYRVTPRLPAGDPRLKKGGLVSIDGESRPYTPFQVEVASVQASTLSLFGRFNVRDVTPPALPAPGSGSN